jgi:FMN-dependent oxidoreductase (nitrilotriacetate monooxygenase family)
MTQQQRRLALNVFFMRFGHHPAAWRSPGVTATGRPDLGYWVGMAKLAEAAKFDTFFVADFIGRSGDKLKQLSRSGGSFQFEPLTLLSTIAAHTQHIGLVATVNTNFSEPYNIARQLASLDHISGGRAGWNVVSSYKEDTAKNFGIKELRGHGDRYERAEEFVAVVKAYWDSWDDDAYDHPDREGNQFFDPRAAHPVKHTGEYFSADGLLDIARPLQGYPVLVQAGNSDTGREFAAKVGEMTYSSATSLDVAQAYYADVKGRLAKYGRDPDDIKIAPGISVVVAETDQEAQDKFQSLQDAVDFSQGLMGLDVSAYPLDGPLPDDIPIPENGRGRIQQLMELGKRENLTIRQLILKFSVAKGHVQVIGTPKKVADLMEQWFVERGADGFNVVPPLLPGGFEDFVRLVVPLLQRRGLVRQEYDGDSFRENLRLKRPANPHTVGVHRSAATAASIDREDAAVAGDANVASAAGGRR